jgi:hypothetical protein
MMISRGKLKDSEKNRKTCFIATSSSSIIFPDLPSDLVSDFILFCINSISIAFNNLFTCLLVQVFKYLAQVLWITHFMKFGSLGLMSVLFWHGFYGPKMGTLLISHC